MAMNQFARFTALAVAFGMMSCSKDGAPSYAKVSGTVTYNGQPLPRGQITFSLEGRPPTMVEIVDGKYSGQAMIGSNRVQIAAFRKRTTERKLPETAKKQIEAYQALNKSGGGQSSDQFDPSMEDYIPPDWGQDSKQIRVVEKSGQNSFDFDIKGS
jgi:hypothetical protein